MTPVRRALAMACLASMTLCAGLARADLQTAQMSEGGLVLRFARLPDATLGTMAVFVDDTDVSALVQRRNDTELLVPATALALLTDVAQVRAWLVQAGQWSAWGQKNLDRAVAATQAATPPTAAAGFRPRLELAVKSQARESARGSQTPSPRPTYQDLTLRAAFDLEQRLDALVLRGSAQLAGASFRQEALTWATRARSAPKIDLADYRFDLAREPVNLSLGHVSTGNHPLLLDRYSSRGLVAAARLSPRWDFAVSAINGTTVTGITNLLGLDDTGHQIHLLTTGFEFDAEVPGRLRAEFSWLDASMRAIGDFNRGQIPDAERIRGLGLRLTGKAWDGRARIDLALARSRYLPAEDPQLLAGAALVPLTPSTRSALQAELAADLLRGWTGWSDKHPLGITLLWRRLHVAPLYKAVGTSVGADQAFDRLAIHLSLGPVQAQLFADSKSDNLDDLPNLLTTRTRNHGLSLALPATWLAGGGDRAPAWVPSISIQLGGNGQQARNAPDFAQSGLAATHRPDQVNRNRQLSLAWTLPQASFNYGWQQAHQDNRQTGRQGADFLTANHQFQFNLPLGDDLMLAFNAGHGRNYSYERGEADLTHSAGVTMDWRIDRHWTLAGHLSLQRGSSSLGRTSMRQYGAQTQLTRRFEWALPGEGKAPGQWFVRHAHNGSRSSDAAFNLDTRGSLWSLQTGLGLSFGTP